MDKKNIIVIVTLFMLGVTLFVGDKKSFANDNVIEDNFNLNLEYNEDKNIFKNDLYNYIDLIDNSLFAMSSFSMSDTLNENYDFLIDFAISFILNNEEQYKDDIIVGEEYVYIDDFGNKYTSNRYVNIELIYDITNSIFGKRDYVVINEQINVSNNLVPLLLIKDNVSFMDISEISDYSLFDNKYNVYVKYRDIDLEYIYVFDNIDGRLILNNVLVEG